MKEINIVQEFKHPLQVLLQAREERYKHLDKFPELKNVEIISEETIGEELKQVRHIHLGSSLPTVLIPLLPKGSDTLIESSVFNHTTNTHDFKVIPDGNNESIFAIEGKSRYYEVNPNESARDYQIKIKSKALFVSMLVESAISEIYTQNLKKDQQSIENFIKIIKEGKIDE